ncbi:MAG: hypothetical protein QW451_00535 [Candidatus Aenigmatarchaeota archaeon]
MKASLAIFILLLFLIFMILKNEKISYTGQVLKNEESSERWRVVARVEVLNGKIVKITKTDLNFGK